MAQTAETKPGAGTFVSLRALCIMRARSREREGHLMSTTKEEAINLITRLPDEASWDDIMYEMYVKKKIELGIKAADEGRVVPHEEVKRIFSVE